MRASLYPGRAPSTIATLASLALLACTEDPSPTVELNAQALASGAGVGTVAWNIAGETPGDRLGESIAGVGDVNGDGFDDLAVGAPYHSPNGLEWAGRVYLFFGSPSGLDFTPSQVIDGDSEEDYWSSVTAAGDVNGDGYRDILIASQIYGEAGVRLFLGGADGVEPTPAWQLPLEPTYPQSLGGVGDIDGDGRSDVMLQVQEFLEGAWEIRFEIYGGTATGLTAAPIWSYVAAPELTAIAAGAGVGDFTGDGYVDVILGTDWCDATYGGRLVGFWGSASGPSLTPNWIGGEGALGCTHIGKEVERAGDLNGDGYADVLTSSGSFASFDFRGRAQAFLGGADPATTPSWDVHTTDNDGWNDVAGLGDTNGDGRNDAVLGLDNFYNPHNGVSGATYPPQGRAIVYQGRASGFLAYSWYAYDERLNGNNFAGSVSNAGDLNGDGWADVAIADYFAEVNYDFRRQGFAYVYYGTGGSSAATGALQSLQIHEPDGAAVAQGARLISTNAFDVSCIGKGTQGRTFVALEVELTTGNTPFDGSDLRTATQYADTGLTGATLRLPITGLQSNTLYHTRARLVYRPDTMALTRHTRWFDGPSVFTNCDDDDPDYDDDDTCDDLDPDDDDDGTLDASDCGPRNASVHPGATEILDDGIDQDCSGADRVTCHVDADGDHHGRDTTAMGEGGCNSAGLSGTTDDCDDTDDIRHPGAYDAPDDDVDQDCDGVDAMRCYVDTDADGYGAAEQILPEGSCPATGLSATPGDCDDAVPSIHFLATETVDDGIDQDCSGEDLVSCFEDADADDFGDTPSGTGEGSCGPGKAIEAGDCDDDDDEIHPGADEVVDDDVDQDCSGADRVSCFRDEDDDGFGDIGGTFREGECNSHESLEKSDCDDSTAAIAPGAEDLPNDGVDQDCDGWDAITCFVDGDADGAGGAAMVVDGTPGCASPLLSTSTDCDDDDADVHPGALETPDDGVDQNCNGHDTVVCFEDADGDGRGAGTANIDADGECRDVPSDDDCDDVRADVHADAEDVPGDGVDQDCDGADAIPGAGTPVMPGAPTGGTGSSEPMSSAPPIVPMDTADAEVEDGGGSGGCGCRIAQPRSETGSFALLPVLVGLAWRRRKRT